MTNPNPDVAPLAPLARLRSSTALRGPRPPALICRDCEAELAAVWENPLLVLAARRGLYAAEPTGGWGWCERCQAAHAEGVRRRDEARWRVLGVPAALADATLDRYERRPGTEAALAVARDWLRNPERDLYLFGRTGTGKTRLAVTLAHEAMRRRILPGPARYVRVPTLIQRLKAAQFDEAAVAGELGRLETYERAGLLILDDLAAEHGTPYTRATVETLYTARLDAGRRTLVTSNLPLGLSLDDQAKPPDARAYRETLGEYLGDDRLPSRLAGHAHLVELGGSDYRLTAGQRHRAQRGRRSGIEG